MQRARVVAAAVVVAIPIGLLGAWAFNPNSGAVTHSEFLWRIFGTMSEGGWLLLVAAFLLFGLVTLIRGMLAIGRPGGA